MIQIEYNLVQVFFLLFLFILLIEMAAVSAFCPRKAVM